MSQNVSETNPDLLLKVVNIEGWRVQYGSDVSRKRCRTFEDALLYKDRLEKGLTKFEAVTAVLFRA